MLWSRACSAHLLRVEAHSMEELARAHSKGLFQASVVHLFGECCSL